MATAPIYCTHKELKRVFPQLDEFDTKVQVFGWTTVSTNKYASHNSGLVTQLFVDGEDLGAAQSAHTDLNVAYDSALSGVVKVGDGHSDTGISSIHARSVNTKINTTIGVYAFN